MQVTEQIVLLNFDSVQKLLFDIDVNIGPNINCPVAIPPFINKYANNIDKKKLRSTLLFLASSVSLVFSIIKMTSL